MNEKETVNFETTFERLKQGEAVPLSTLYTFSDLAPEQLARLRESWPTIKDEQRRVFSRHLADISEGNFRVNFSSVFGIFLTDEQAEVRLAGLDGLWDSDNVRLIKPIISLMEDDPEVKVRTLAAATLGHFVLMAEWEQIPFRKAEPIVAALLTQYDDKETPQPVRRAALESLGASSHERLPNLIEDAYDTAILELQISAIFAMGRSANKRWSRLVIDEMGSPVKEMRFEAARAAGYLGDSDAVRELIDLAYDEERDVQLAAIRSMGKIGGQLAIDFLEEIAQDEDFASPDLEEVIEEALDESLMWADMDLSLLDFEMDDEDEELLDL